MPRVACFESTPSSSPRLHSQSLELIGDRQVTRLRASCSINCVTQGLEEKEAPFLNLASVGVNGSLRVDCLKRVVLLGVEHAIGEALQSSTPPCPDFRGVKGLCSS